MGTRKINEKEKEGWTIVAQDNNYSSLGSPWTLFKTPVSTVSFAGEILKFNEQFFYSKKLVTFYQSFDHTVEDYFHNIYDCYNQKITTVDPDIDSNNFTWDDWEWREIKSNSIDNDFYQYICAKNNGEKN